MFLMFDYLRVTFLLSLSYLYILPASLLRWEEEGGTEIREGT